MPEKKKILIFIDWFLPGYKAGGPIQSVVNLINHLGHAYDFDVVTSNKDLGEVAAYPNITFNEWIERENCRVIYLDERNQNLKRYREILREKQYDSVYFNSLFSVNYTLKPLLVLRNFKVKLILAPRGMLGEGALNIKPLKKKVFLKLFRSFGFSSKINWHATAASEATEIKQHFGEDSKVRIATNLSAVMANDFPEKKKDEGFLNLFFLSRISKKKNLKAALQYLSSVNNLYNINFSIIGPVEEEKYWQECLEIVDDLPKNIRVKNIGAVPNHHLKEELKDQHFMLLPTFHENFGHVIMESWQNACPVIISNNTPWEQLEQKKIGFDIPLEQEEQFIKAIEKVTAMDQAEYNDWSKAAFDFAKEYCNDPKAIEASRQLFE
ncbi:glycosyltransferase involved in cell wall biosynthesis [Gramella sp. Hel_I_59]|uniref:glycosyltransferase family 4 protein n=1 Tax=Gramella sp. Hel_I_59 TaxID=1249978 RepID=UPI0011542EF2|nr:glycosyltransferase family 4 protein [Gramella sp. Hel_I_59]TQI71936.1 glycosyltransferase involved in cell wall biosynthesis [Gramella sp. Hel_I_59]